MIGVPCLKAVLSALERMRLHFFGIDCDFQEIEEELTSFVEKIREVKHGSAHELESSQRADYNADHY